MKSFARAIQLTIRLYEPSDLGRVSDIERESFPDPWSELQFRLTHWRNPHGFLVAVRDGDVVGYVIAEVVRYLDYGMFQLGKRGHILNIAVDPEFRRMGIGKALIEAAITYLHAEGAKDVQLEVRDSNLTARSFYLRLGFEKKGRKPRYYLNEDAIVMMKRL